MTESKPLPSPRNPELALAAVVALRRKADQLERKAVLEAILQGWSWSEVAQALGVSKQAAHKKYAKIVKSKSKTQGIKHVSKSFATS